MTTFFFSMNLVTSIQFHSSKVHPFAARPALIALFWFTVGLNVHSLSTCFCFIFSALSFCQIPSSYNLVTRSVVETAAIPHEASNLAFISSSFL